MYIIPQYIYFGTYELWKKVCLRFIPVVKRILYDRMLTLFFIALQVFLILICIVSKYLIGVYLV